MGTCTHQNVYIKLDPWGRLPREQTKTTKLLRISLRVVMLLSGYLHQGNIDFVKNLEYLISRTVERIRAARNGRANEEEECKVK